MCADGTKAHLVRPSHLSNGTFECFMSCAHHEGCKPPVEANASCRADPQRPDGCICNFPAGAFTGGCPTPPPDVADAVVPVSVRAPIFATAFAASDSAAASDAACAACVAKHPECAAGPPSPVAGDKEALVALFRSAGGAGWTDPGGWADCAEDGARCDGSDPCQGWGDGARPGVKKWRGVGGVFQDDGCDEHKRVTSIDLSDSKLDGTLPPSLAALTALGSLDLSGNRLRGTIPADAACAWTRLASLDLSDNLLEGEIPACLGAGGGLGGLTSLDLSGNPGLRLPAGVDASAFCSPRQFTYGCEVPG
jgi:Leucine-rich repeat (LRR) protein